jgi:N12 class adenine-specific DNA methylase
LPSKFELITKVYYDMCKEVVRSPQAWQRFLESACRNYRLRFDEQLLVFAQRPDATAVLEFEKWNRRFGRHINRGAKGIAVFENAEKTRIKHYFDISDTSDTEHARPVPIWKYKDEYEQAVIETLENTFGELEHKNDMIDAVISVADNATEDNTLDYISDLIRFKYNSFLEELDEDGISTIYRTLIKNSVAYMILSRLGVSADQYFGREEFAGAVNFNTPETLNAVGFATSDIAEIALNEVSKTVLSLEKSDRIIAKPEQVGYTETEIKNERSVSNDRTHIQNQGRSADTESDPAHAEEFDIEQIWADEKTVSQGGTPPALLQSADNGQARQSSDGDGRESESDGAILDETDGGTGGLDGGTQSSGSDGLGTENEQFEKPSAGDRAQRSYLPDLSGELPPFTDENLILGILSNPDDNLKQKKTAIAKFFAETSDNTKRADFIKDVYPYRFTELILNEQRVGYVTAENGLLLWRGSYPSRTEESVFSWDIVAELVGQLIDEGNYLPKEKKAEPAQISLFDTADIPDEQNFTETEQVSFFTDLGVSQQIIDEVLCIGANDQNSTLDIAMFFRRDRGTAYNAAFLKRHYGTNGTGFLFQGEHISVWYDESGIKVSRGDYANRSGATLVTWKQAAKRIRELLDMGRYMPQESLDKIDDKELSVVSDRLATFIRDMRGDNAKEYLPTIRAITDNVKGGYPEEVKAVKELLSDAERFDTIFREYDDFQNAVSDGTVSVYRYGYEYSVPYVFEIFKGMRLAPLEFKAAADFAPRRERFITEDEIKRIIRGHDAASEFRLATYSFFLSHSDEKERVQFFKDHYGWQGSYDGSDNIEYGAKGLLFSHGDLSEPYAKAEIPWKRYVKYVEDLITGRNFLSQADLESVDDYERKQVAKAVMDFWIGVPFGNQKPDFYNDSDYWNSVEKIAGMLESPDDAENIQKAMLETSNAVTFEERYRDYAENGLKTIEEYVNGTYTCFGDKSRTIAPLIKVESKPAEKETELPEWLTEYREIKAEDPQALVFYQVGDFYECYFDDAKTVADELDLVLTGRNAGGERISMCGFPKHSLDEYMGRFSEKGYRIAVSSAEKGERITTWYTPDYSEEVQKAQDTKETDTIPAFETAPKTNPYTFDLHPEIPLDERHDFDFANHEIQDVNKKERFHRNYAAIKVLKDCQSENRFATPEEQMILSRYYGWGGIPEAFDERADTWRTEYAMLKNILTPDEYASARKSTLTAFYTPQPVISAIYKVMENLGFKQGNILEPCCAIGNFIGMLPESMKDSKVYGIEIDNISAGIAQQLYQSSSVMNAPFEKAELPDSFFDAVVGNVPFGDYSLADKRYDKYHFLIHDYFFAKSLDKLRPGGVICLVTSKGTMDKESTEVRRYIAQRAELLGAIRLPDNTFKSNAGTEVTSDILILQKRDRIIDIEPDWIFLDEDENGIRMNKYFVDHPDMVLGEMVMQSGRFKPESACKAYEDRTLEEQLEVAVQNIEGEISEYTLEDTQESEETYIPADPNVRNFSYTVVDGQIYFRENSVMREVQTSETAKNRIKGMIEIRDCVKNLLEMQTEDYSDAAIDTEQRRLNEIYDTFVKKYGYINSRGNASAFSDDSSYFLICSLEIFKDGEFERKADMFTKRTIQPHIAKTHADTSIEAYGISIGEKAKVDMPFMCELTGKSEEEIYSDLKGVIFLNPAYDENSGSVSKYLPADEYLSGNVRTKLREAKRLAESDERFMVNAQALEKVQPVDLKANEIEVHLGVTWLPLEIIDRFMYETFQTPYYTRSSIKVHYNELANVWNITNKSADNINLTVTQKYGTSRKNAFHILEATLNLRNVRVFDYEEDENGKRVAILNKKETAIAQAKQELIKQTFKEWIWKDPKRREKLCKLYNEKFNSIRPREYDGSHIVFEGMNPEITLRTHQKNAVARGIYGGNTLLAHCVGAGKTYTMAAIAQESKRLGLCSKSLFVVPNHLISQWASEYLTLYPSAKILAATKKDFETKNRKKFCARIATGDYDAVIIGHSQFEKIPVSIGRQMFTLQKQIDELVEGITELKQSKGERFTVKQLEATKIRLESKLQRLNDQSGKDDIVTFEELGVDRLFVDEAHYYKNLFVYSKMKNVGGISQIEAHKSSDMFMKCQYLDELTESKGITFATGTPISNSMVELYTMQRYLQYDLLKEYGYVNFDSWAAQYGETVTAVELTPEGTGYRTKVRFARFNNLPELMAIFKECADIETSDMLKLPVSKANYHNISVKPSEMQKEMVANLGERAEKIRAGAVKPYEDNMLNITNDGRKLALDQRLINPSLPDFEGSKVNACISNIYDIWKDTAAQRSTQLVFCDRVAIRCYK